ncbi:PHP domain-containing protein [Bacteroidota bacterium]
MKILNPDSRGDYHIHTSTFSDGFNSIDEIVIHAGQLGLKEIAITDHSQSLLDAYGYTRRTHYEILHTGRWQNVHNDVKVIFGVEADILNEEGDICDDIQGFKPDFVILSSHKKIYQGNPELIKEGYLNALKRFGSKIKFLGHLCSHQFSDFLKPDDIVEIVKAANDMEIAVEINGANLMHNKTILENLDAMLSSCNDIYINSDAHTLHEFYNAREVCFKYLKENSYL